jgi:hypothetical protein
MEDLEIKLDGPSEERVRKVLSELSWQEIVILRFLVNEGMKTIDHKKHKELYSKLFDFITKIQKAYLGEEEFNKLISN